MSSVSLMRTVSVSFALFCFVSVSLFFSFDSALADGDDPALCTRQWYDAHSVVASTLDIDYINLFEMLQSGQSIADIAHGLDVEVQTVIDRLVATERGLVEGLEEQSCITAAEAEAWVAGLEDEMMDFVMSRAEVEETLAETNLIYLPLLMK